MTSNNHSKFDPLIAYRAVLTRFCSSLPDELARQMIAEGEELLESGKQMNAIAGEFAFDGLAENGFAVYLTLLTACAKLTVQQIEQNKVDFEFFKLSRFLYLYRDWLLDIYESLKSEKLALNGKEQHLIMKRSYLRSRFLHELVNIDDEAIQLKFTRYNAFWLPADIRRMLKFFSLIFAVRYNPPFTLSALFSDRSLGKICAKLFAAPTLEYPFDVWQTSENWFVCNSVNFFANLGVPVKSRTLHVPKQTRIRLDHKGNILDFYAMTSEEIDEYFQDQIEQERQSSPGRRHRNSKSTIRCRYSYITSKEKVAESLQRVREGAEPKQKVLNWRTVRRMPTNYSPDSDPVANRLNLERNLNLKSNLNQPENNRNPKNKLLLFIHGGGFFTQGSQSYEVFLRKLVNQLGGVPMLAIDYSLTVPYPIPLQETLDVYLWLISGAAEVKQALGFHPQKIVLSGDSCGGFLSITLTIVLNELNKMLNNCCNKPVRIDNGFDLSGFHSPRSASQSIRLPIRLPVAIVAEYPAITLTNLSPSVAFGIFDSLVDGHLFMLMISMYGANVATNGDFKRIEKNLLSFEGERYQKIAARNADQFVEQNNNHLDYSQKNDPKKNSKNDDSLPWFACDYATYVNRADYIDSFFAHPFINPLLYEDKLEELKEVALYAMVGTADFLLDHSIELARLWKGKVSLDLFDKTIHGFMQFTAFSAESREAFEIVIKRHQEACFSN